MPVGTALSRKSIPPLTYAKNINLHLREMKMKFLFIIALLINTAVKVRAQQYEEPIHKVVTLHTIAFADTYDPAIGKFCQQDLNNISREFEYIAVAANLKYEDHNKHILTINNFSTKAIDSILKTSWKGETFSQYDVLIVYFSSHGYRVSEDTTLFPNLAIENEAFKGINSYSLHQHIRNQVRFNLQITIIDACNKIAHEIKETVNYIKTPGLIQNQQPPESTIQPSSIPIIVNSIDRINYTELFRNVSGEVIITSSQPGYYSYPDPRGGSFFTNSLINSLHREKSLKNNTKNWQNIFEDAKSETVKNIKAFKGFSNWADYKPVWNDTISLIDYVHPNYGVYMTAGKEFAENEKYQLKVSYVKDSAKRDTIVNCFINPKGEWGRSAETMLSEMHSVQYKIYSKNADGSYSLQTMSSNNRDNNFNIQLRGKQEDKIMAVIKFNSGLHCRLNIMHF
ncbi:hypothetical protein HB364_21920 [Pseudoflavitalea sp. X16]|uniref:caspase family protein n=1 Tax=Paraflavitalea devenefica TaxID=2716334 RepID=UPI0014248006|nr:caspase family protein [Paraflavitalea devenefica]NII27756.1 hypothetical protein [Paraflavitalea devenefica]